MTKSLRIGLAGLGTVGVGTFNLLKKNKKLIFERCGREIEIVAVTAKNKSVDRGIDLSEVQWVEDPVKLANINDIDVFVELIGGESGVAKESIEAALNSGKSVVTANKALLAHHGFSLAKLSEENNVNLLFEAAVAGGIPIVKALRDSLAGNEILRLNGIMNGTCNFILTKMESTGRGFDDVLLEAQEQGYAESDPSFDIDGLDTAHKLAIVINIAFGVYVKFDDIYFDGIRNIKSIDIAYAKQLGFRIKLLGIIIKSAKGIEKRVHPCMIPEHSSLARIDGVNNAIYVEGNFSGPLIFEGYGAGSGPTSSAVVSDLIDLARGINISAFGLPVQNLKEFDQGYSSERFGPWYMRLEVIDHPGVLADISTKLRDNNVSIESVLQRGRSPGEKVSVIFITHDASEANFGAAINEIKNLEALSEPPCLIRIENF